jgi:predicted metal-dependent hydrolase
MAMTRAAPDANQLSLFDAEPPPRRAPPAAPLPSAPLQTAPVVPTAALSFMHPRAQREIVFGEHRVAYELRRVRRRSIGFIVGSEGLTVSAPRWVGLGEVEVALRDKATWILRKLHEQRERARRLAETRIDWRDGTVLPFLGEKLIVVLDARATGAVLHCADPMLPDASPRALHLGLPQAALPAQIRDAAQSWLQRQARHTFEERCAVYAPRLGVRVKRLALSSAATRWGSASADGSVRLNWRLVHFALPVIDYVVTHELAHLREMNHSAAFWGVVRSVLPDYEAARAKLRHEVLPVLD